MPTSLPAVIMPTFPLSVACLGKASRAFLSGRGLPSWLSLVSLMLAGVVWLSAGCLSRAHAQTPGVPTRPVIGPPPPAPGEKPLIYEDTLPHEKRKVSKKKIPKKTFWGIKTRKAFTRVKSGRKTTYELFYVLKKPLVPDPYVRDIHWFHHKKRKVFVGPIPDRDKEFARILHGPYKRTINKTTVETGQFYVGTKHGRFERMSNNEDEILIEKEKWNKGWPKESEMVWYDGERTKLKEVIPIVNGERHGEYFQFYASGGIAEHGKYEFGQKVGVWREYYDNKRKVKVETQHAPDAWTNQEPYRIREYDAKGLIVYDKATEDKKAAAAAGGKPKSN